MKKRVIPTKNYIICAILAICTIALCIYLSVWYKTVHEYYKNNSVITDVISEIECDSFSSYLLDNPDVAVYVASSKDEQTIKFEKSFKKLIINNNLGNKILYLDVTKEENQDALKILKDNYLSSSLSSLKEIPYPNMIIFQNGQITSVLYRKNREITISDVKKFLEKKEIITND